MDCAFVGVGKEPSDRSLKEILNKSYLEKNNHVTEKRQAESFKSSGLLLLKEGLLTLNNASNSAFTL